jgi:hypothetical protein
MDALVNKNLSEFSEYKQYYINEYVTKEGIMEKIKKNIFYIFLVIVAIALFFFGRSCASTTIVKPKDNKVITTVKHYTIVIRDTITKIQFKTSRPLSYTVVEYVPTKDTASIRLLQAIRAYQDSVRDENLVIYSKDTVKGYLMAQKLSYRLFVPKIIKDSVVVTKDSLIPTLPKWQFGVGIDATPKALDLNLNLTIKRITYVAGYDPINKLPKVGIKVILFKSKK